jgi:uncharacterized protein involved in outer membrane biogenesis
MKKILVRILIGLVVLLVLICLGITLFLDGAIKRGVEVYGPRFAKVQIALQSVKLSLLSGSGTIKGLVVGNPEGFKTSDAIRIGTLSLSLKPSSLLSDKVVVKSLHIESPEITFETDLKNSNLKKIESNLNESTGSGKAPPPAPTPSSQAKEEKAANRKLEVDDLVISGGKVNLSVSILGGKSVTMPLPEIRLNDLGTGPDGITVAELAKLIIQKIKAGAEQSASGALGGLGSAAGSLTKDAGNTATNALGKVGKGIGGLFKGN